MDQDRILEKIKKCLALSESPVAAEAAAALRQAQKLMEIHGISQLDVQRADIGTAEFASKASVSRIKDWELRLVTRTAKAFGCRVMWRRSFSWAPGDAIYGRYTLVGLKSQVEVAQYTCDVMTRKLVKARAQFVNELSHDLDRSSKTRLADGFCHGWVAAVEKTVSEFAMGDATQKMIDEVVAERTKGSTVNAQQRYGSADGYYAGKEAGAKESIHRPMRDQADAPRLGN